MSDLIHKIVGKIIEVGQSDTTKFRLGETIRYTPSEILEILKQHENEIFGEDPSTQVNASNVLNALDTISRQAAIDTIRRIKANYCETADDQILLIDKAMAMTELMILPSVQPEIIRCKDCLHWVRTCGDNQWGLGDCDVFDKHLVMCEGYCAWAERRTNGSD